MPELPEVETLCRQLQKKIAGKKISVTDIYDSKLAPLPNISGRTISAVRRNGKTIEMLLDNDNSLLIHLRMTGRLLWQKESDQPKHSRWHLSFGSGNLYLVDPRRFATVKILPTQDHPTGHDILRHFAKQKFLTNYGWRKTKIKNLLMDQRAVTGIGNIYACEILHGAGIHPERIVATLTPDEWQKIFEKAKSILQKAIVKRGTSISDWRDLNGQPGENQYILKAYGQEGKKCKRCSGIITRIKQGGRSTFYCPECQK
ncbi:MAG: Formamidopyrimidine-DNA glycosylase [Smithella sp. PtaU1.Bin162]|nr:MAG: Formamidopyrimidine-DNA glycosylase [Smithella sp. PtaU1.Bin162]